MAFKIIKEYKSKRKKAFRVINEQTKNREEILFERNLKKIKRCPLCRTKKDEWNNLFQVENYTIRCTRCGCVMNRYGIVINGE